MPQIIINDFDHAENYASDYLRTFFTGEPTSDVKVMMSFLVDRFKVIGPKDCLLEVGCGPTVNQLFPAVPYVSEFHMADYRLDALEEIEKWKGRSTDAHDWSRFTRFALQLEGVEKLLPEMIERREEQLRQRITRLTYCDLRKENPLGEKTRYPLVACFYATEQASSTLEEWQHVMRNLSSLVEPGGHLLMCALGESDHYVVYGNDNLAKRYTVPKLTLHNLAQSLSLFGFDEHSLALQYTPLEGQEAEGVSGVICAHAQKSASI